MSSNLVAVTVYPPNHSGSTDLNFLTLISLFPIMSTLFLQKSVFCIILPLHLTESREKASIDFNPLY